MSRPVTPRPASFTLDHEPWKDVAACRDAGDPDRWFPEPGDDPGRKAEALRICRTQCLVRFDCLRYALARGEPGIWGGMTRNQRSHLLTQIRRKRQAARESGSGDAA